LEFSIGFLFDFSAVGATMREKNDTQGD